jgi:hypothetical protein
MVEKGAGRLHPTLPELLRVGVFDDLSVDRDAGGADLGIEHLIILERLVDAGDLLDVQVELDNVAQSLTQRVSECLGLVLGCF